MKIVSWIIVIIILAVSLTPCKDSLRVSTEISFSSQTQADSHRDSAGDTCSPFCVCTCCSTPTVIKQIVVHKGIFSVIKKEYTDTYSGNIAAASLSIWQPPKLFS